MSDGVVSIEKGSINKKEQEKGKVHNAVLTLPVQAILPIRLSDEQRRDFRHSIKAGIYKQMHKEGMFTDTQLMKLLFVK